MIGMRYPFEVNLVGDAAADPRALIPLLNRKSDRVWRETVEQNVAGWWDVERARADVGADPINPMRVFANCPLGCPTTPSSPPTPGPRTNWYARHLKFRGRMRGSLSGHPGHHGCRGAVRDRREVRAPGPARRSRWSATARCR